MTFFLGGSIFFLGLYTFFSGNIFLKISISLKISLDSPSIYCIALGLTALVYIIDAAPRPRLRVPLQEFFFSTWTLSQKSSGNIALQPINRKLMKSSFFRVLSRFSSSIRLQITSF